MLTAGKPQNEGVGDAVVEAEIDLDCVGVLEAMFDVEGLVEVDGDIDIEGLTDTPDGHAEEVIEGVDDGEGIGTNRTASASTREPVPVVAIRICPVVDVESKSKGPTRFQRLPEDVMSMNTTLTPFK